MPATDIGHPEEDRPLSVQEYKRVQQFPDEWTVCGSVKDQYKQIGNAVPVGLGEAVGRAILAHMAHQPAQAPAGFSFSRYKGTDEMVWESNTRVVLGLDEKLAKSSIKSRSARVSKRPREEKQTSLFALEAA